MKKYILLLTAFMGTGNIMASPQLSGAEDSLSVRKTYYIDEVVVTGTRHQTDVRHLSQTVSVVNRNKLERAMQPSLLPVLTEQVPGLFVTSRGVMATACPAVRRAASPCAD